MAQVGKRSRSEHIDAPEQMIGGDAVCRPMIANLRRDLRRRNHCSLASSTEFFNTIH